MAAFGESFWWQAGALAAAVLALHVRAELKQAGRVPTDWRVWREIAASIAVCVLLFALASGGRGCAGSTSPDDEWPLDAADPFGRD